MNNQHTRCWVYSYVHLFYGIRSQILLKITLILLYILFPPSLVILMAASNNTLPSFSPSSITTLISIKLTASNYLLWHSQFVLLLRSQKLMGYIDGTIPWPASLISNGGSDATAGSIPNLAFDKWLTTDQVLLSWINAPLAEKFLLKLSVFPRQKIFGKSSKILFHRDQRPGNINWSKNYKIAGNDRENLFMIIFVVLRISDSLGVIGQPISDEDKVICVLMACFQHMIPLLLQYLLVHMFLHMMN